MLIDRRLPVALALAAAALLLPAPGAHAAFNTKPYVECSTYLPATDQVTTRFGYENRNAAIDNIPVGDFNYFEPDPLNRGQPAQFLPGRGSASFDVTAKAGAPPKWVLNGYPATGPASADAARFGAPCADRGAQVASVVPAAVRGGIADQRVTLFGQRLAGAAVSVSGDGVAVTVVRNESNQRLDLNVTVDPTADPAPRDLLVTDPSGAQVGCESCLALDAPEPPPAEEEPSNSTVTSEIVDFASDTKLATAVATCPAGTSAISGGYEVAALARLDGVSVITDRPAGTRMWRVVARTPRPTARGGLRAYAVCS